MRLSPAWRFRWRCSPKPRCSGFFTPRSTRSRPCLCFTAKSYESFTLRIGNAFRFWRDETASRASDFTPTSTVAVCRYRKSRSSRKNRTARLRCRAERVSRDAGRFSFYPGARRLGTDGMGPGFVFVSTSHHFATACPDVLGRGGVAYGLERERGRDERSIAAAARSAGESATRIFLARQRFPRTRDQK